MTLICVDIDGNLADIRWRIREAGPEPKHRGLLYNKWLNQVQSHKKMAQDPKIPGMKILIRALFQANCYVVYITGRSEDYRTVTAKWLKDNKFPLVPLFMRPMSNHESSGPLKEKIIKRIIKKQPDIKHVVVMDDDYNEDIEEACKRNKWTFLKNKSGSYW